jgi:uncharacterized protein YndB with AHSA1/START domain
MTKGFTAKAQIIINTSPANVWESLTNPELIKQYLFGTEVVTDWKVGSDIIYKGVWQGKVYEDKGKILEIIPEMLIQSTYWSSMSGSQDVPENYSTVTYELTPKNGGTLLMITQDNNATEESRNHSEQNWKMVLGDLKKLLEG